MHYSSRIVFICVLLLEGRVHAQSRGHKVDLSNRAYPQLAASASNGNIFNADVKNQGDIPVKTVGNGGNYDWNVGAGSGSSNAAGNTAGTDGKGGYIATNRIRSSGTLGKVNQQNWKLGDSRNSSRQLDVNYNNTGARGYNPAVGSEKWSAQYANNAAVASQDIPGGGVASATNLNNQQNIQLSSPRGKGIATALDQNGQRIATYRDPNNLLERYQASAQDTGGGNTEVRINSKGLPIYAGRTNERLRSSTIQDPTGNIDIIEVRADSYKEGYCTDVRFDNKFDGNDEFRILQDTVNITYKPQLNETGHLVYTWPSCFDISMVMVLPPKQRLPNGQVVPYDVKDLAAQVEISMPDGLEFQCQDKYNCLPRKCLYRTLCSEQKFTQGRNKIGFEAALANSTNNACNTGVVGSNGQLPFKASVCPSEADYDNGRFQSFSKQLNLFGSAKADVDVTMRLFYMKTKVTTCPDFWIESKLELIGCRAAQVSFTTKVFGQETITAQQGLDQLKSKVFGVGGGSSTSTNTGTGGTSSSGGSSGGLFGNLGGLFGGSSGGSSGGGFASLLGGIGK